MDKKQYALDLFKSGFSCSQAVFVPFAEAFGMDRVQALKLATPFGGGMGGTGDVCGAVSGALMAIGLKHGRGSLEDTDAKITSYNKAETFLKKFEQTNGALECRGLLGYDFSVPGEREKAVSAGVMREKCSEFVRSAVEILEEIMG